ncbi:MAG: amidase [Alphaproteobacteria bacterium]|nr:amidase [Alphaproteobacteria bacterium]
MTPDDLLDLDLTAVAGLIRRRKISSVEVTRACLKRIERVQPIINCFIRIEGEAALKAAKRADAALAKGKPLGPLHGVPLAHKDMFYRKGQVTTCGSKIRRDYVATEDCTALTRLLDAGSIYVGGLNMAEFAIGPTGHNAHHGHCRNPWNPDHVTGGSSSGSGSSVGARAVFGALGSDTGGSVRLPASMCGVVGMKPTTGLVSRFGAMPLSFTLDTIGPLTRSVRDNAKLLRLIAGPDANDPTTIQAKPANPEAWLAKGAKGLRIGIPKSYFFDVASNEVRALYDESMATFRKLGAKLVEVELPDMARLTQLSNLVLAAEAATRHTRWLIERPGDYQEQVHQRLEPGLFAPAVAYLQALDARGAMLDEFCVHALTKADILAVPGMPFAVPKVDDTNVGGSPAAADLVARISWCTRIANYLGVPALTLPCGFTGNHLPAGLQLIGRPFAEPLLYRAAAAFEREINFSANRPPII